MATSYTLADSLGVYLTGKYGHIDNYDADNSYGGPRLGLRDVAMQGLYLTPIAPLRIDEIIGPTAGDGVIAAMAAGSVRYTAPGDTAGATVAIANGETKLLPSGTATGAVRVTRETADDLAKFMTLRLLAPYNNAIGMDNVTHAERVAGLNTYRGVIVRNDAPSGNITSLTCHIKTLGTQRTSNTTQLGGAGAGTIVTTGSFADWPAAGWCRITTVAPALREIVYYTSRTATALTVPAAGRGRLGTTAAAGAATDTIIGVPGIRIAEDPVAAAAIQRVTNDATAPAGVSWSTGITTATGLTLGTAGTLPNTDGMDGLWIHREIPAGATVSVQQESGIVLSWTHGAIAYSLVFRGYYRMADSAFNIFELWKGEDAAPNFAGATSDTDTALPLTVAVASPGSGTKAINITVRRRNQYNLVSQNVWYNTKTINSAGAEVVAEVQAPHDVALTQTTGGEAVVTATYDHFLDADPADIWRIYATITGVDPVPGVDTPLTQTMIPFGLRTTTRKLAYTLGPYDRGTDLRVIVTTYRSTVGDTAESTNTTASTVTISTTIPVQPSGRGVQFGERHYLPTPPDVDTTTYSDQPNNIYIRLTPGNAWLYGGATLIMRAIYDGSGLAENAIYLNSALTINTLAAVTGTGTDDAIETAAWNGTKQLFINVNELRRAEINLTTAELKAANISTLGMDYAEARSQSVRMGNRYTTFYLLDPYSNTWKQWLELSLAGELKTDMTINNMLSQATIEAL